MVLNLEIGQLPDLTRQPDVDYSDLIAEADQDWRASQSLGPLMLGFLQDAVGDYWGDLYLRSSHADEASAVLEQFHGRRVIEPGCGPEPRKFHHLLGSYKPSDYIGIDQGVNLSGRPTVSVPEAGRLATLSANQGDPLTGMVVAGDMLNVISRLPDHYGSYVINGVDNSLIKSGSPYGQALMREIYRTTEPGGIIAGITFAGGILTELPGHFPFEERVALDSSLPSVKQGLFCYAKV